MTVIVPGPARTRGSPIARTAESYPDRPFSGTSLSLRAPPVRPTAVPGHVVRHRDAPFPARGLSFGQDRSRVRDRACRRLGLRRSPSSPSSLLPRSKPRSSVAGDSFVALVCSVPSATTTVSLSRSGGTRSSTSPCGRASTAALCTTAWRSCSARLRAARFTVCPSMPPTKAPARPTRAKMPGPPPHPIQSRARFGSSTAGPVPR